MMSIHRNCKAKIGICFKSSSTVESELIARSIRSAMAPEERSRQDAYSGLETHISIVKADVTTPTKLLLEIKSSDISTLRAAINSYLRLISASLRICEASVTNSS